MNIGLFADCYRPTPSGVVTSAVQLKAGLEHRGHRVVVLTVATPPYEEEDATVYRLRSIPFSQDNGWRLGMVRQRQVNRIVERERLDVIHTHTEFSLGWAGKRAARALHLPWIHTAHTLYEEYRHYLLGGRWLPRHVVRRYLSWFLDGCDILICPSRKSWRYFGAVAPAARRVVVGNPVDGNRFARGRLSGQGREQVRKGLGLGFSDRVILYAGRLGREKRVLELLHVLAPLLRRDPRCKALFAGGGLLRQALSDAAARLGVQGQVILVGPVPWEQMHAVYSIADVFATASLSENHPMTCLEAMACGLPVVARRDDSLTGLVGDGTTGCLADSDLAIAEHLIHLLDNEAKRRAFSENAAFSAGLFSVKAHVERIESLYLQLATAPYQHCEADPRGCAPPNSDQDILHSRKESNGGHSRTQGRIRTPQEPGLGVRRRRCLCHAGPDRRYRHAHVLLHPLAGPRQPVGQCRLDHLCHLERGQ